MAAHTLIQPRFLKALRGQQRGVHTVVGAVLAKQRGERAIAGQFLGASSVLRPVKIADVTIANNIAKQRPLAVVLHKRVKKGLELRAVRANGPGKSPALAQYQVFADCDASEDLLPHLWLVAVNDRPG